MKFYSIIFFLGIVASMCCEQPTKHVGAVINKKQTSVTYQIVLRTVITEPTGDDDTVMLPGEIDTLSILKLTEPLVGLTALYSAIGGTMCNGTACELTTALGLGDQGSEKHKSLIKKYFPDSDKIAQTVLRQDCYLRPSGSSCFTDYEYLRIIDKGDSVLMGYRLGSFCRGEISSTEGVDTYLYKHEKFFKIKRGIWNAIDE